MKVKLIDKLSFYEWKEYQKIVNLDMLAWFLLMLCTSMLIINYPTEQWVKYGATVFLFGLMVAGMFYTQHKIKKRFLTEYKNDSSN